MRRRQVYDLSNQGVMPVMEDHRNSFAEKEADYAEEFFTKTSQSITVAEFNLIKGLEAIYKKRNRATNFPRISKLISKFTSKQGEKNKILAAEESLNTLIHETATCENPEHESFGLLKGRLLNAIFLTFDGKLTEEKDHQQKSSPSYDFYQDLIGSGIKNVKTLIENLVNKEDEDFTKKLQNKINSSSSVLREEIKKDLYDLIAKKLAANTNPFTVDPFGLQSSIYNNNDEEIFLDPKNIPGREVVSNTTSATNFKRTPSPHPYDPSYDEELYAAPPVTGRGR